MEETLEDFMKRVKKVNEPRKHRFMNSPVGDFYRYFFDIRPDGKEYKIGRPMYQKILAMANQRLTNHLLENGRVPLLYIGEVWLKKYKSEPKIENGKLRYTAPVDWKKTFELWKEYGVGGVVKRENVNNWFYKYELKYHKQCKNSHLFTFQPCRTLRKTISERIKNNQAIAFMRNEKWKDS